MKVWQIGQWQHPLQPRLEITRMEPPRNTEGGAKWCYQLLSSFSTFWTHKASTVDLAQVLFCVALTCCIFAEPCSFLATPLLLAFLLLTWLLLWSSGLSENWLLDLGNLHRYLRWLALLMPWFLWTSWTWPNFFPSYTFLLLISSLWRHWQLATGGT